MALDFKDFETSIRSCRLCEAYLPAPGPRPLIQASPLAKILIIGQAPGSRAAASGIPWDDESGKRLRDWLGIDASIFYDKDQIALMPMGFCYPGPGKGGDLPPRRECAPTWHEGLLERMPKVSLKLLIGQFAHARYLDDRKGENLTATVQAWKTFLPLGVLPLVHPSPRNRFWLAKNPWFEAELIPELRTLVAARLTKSDN